MAKRLNILVVNALDGGFPIELRKRYPKARIICAEYFNETVSLLRDTLKLEVIRWDDVEKLNMKFDLIVGNPPYQNGDNSSFYKQFITKSQQHTDTLVFVVPSTYFGNLNNFKNISDYKYVGEAFSGVSVSAAWFTWRKNYTGPVKVYGDDNQTLLVDKLTITPTQDLQLFKFVTGIVNRKLPGYRIDSGGLSRNKAKLVDNGVKCIWGAGKRGGDYDWVMIDTQQADKLFGLGKHKVVFSGDTASTYIGATKYADPTFGCGMKCRAIVVDSKEQADNLIQYLNSKFVKTMIPQLKGISTGNSNRVFNKIPKVDLNQSWTDEQIYAHFQLSDKDIQYIEQKQK